MVKCMHGRHHDVSCDSCDNEKQRKSFTAMAVSALRKHRWCGDSYLENGWKETNAALAIYALKKHYDKARYKTPPAALVAVEMLEEMDEKQRDFWINKKIK